MHPWQGQKQPSRALLPASTMASTFRRVMSPCHSASLWSLGVPGSRSPSTTPFSSRSVDSSLSCGRRNAGSRGHGRPEIHQAPQQPSLFRYRVGKLRCLLPVPGHLFQQKLIEFFDLFQSVHPAVPPFPAVQPIDTCLCKDPTHPRLSLFSAQLPPWVCKRLRAAPLLRASSSASAAPTSPSIQTARRPISPGHSACPRLMQA